MVASICRRDVFPRSRYAPPPAGGWRRRSVGSAWDYSSSHKERHKDKNIYLQVICADKFKVKTQFTHLNPMSSRAQGAWRSGPQIASTILAMGIMLINCW